MAHYRQEILINKWETDLIDRYLHEELPEDEIQGEDDTIVHTAIFDNGIQMDIKCCGVQYYEGEDNTSWTESVLFTENGYEIGCSEVCDEYLGLWMMEDDDNTYEVVVGIEGEPIDEYAENEIFTSA